MAVRVRIISATALSLLVAACTSAASSPAPQPSAAAPVTLTLTGQTMLRSDLRSSDPEAIPRIRSLLTGDIVFTNLEVAIAEPGQSAAEGRGFLAPPGAIDALQAMGFNLLSLANNHAYDLKALGIENTLRATKARGMTSSGAGLDLAEAGAPTYMRSGDTTIALISIASGAIAEGGGAASGHPGINELRVLAGDTVNQATADLPAAPANRPHPEDAKRILASIREAKKTADVVVVYQHNHVFGNRGFLNLFNEGLSDRLAPNKWLIDWVHAEVNAGADLVVMHGAPLLHGIEIYREKPVFYDLGNFIFNVPPTASSISEPMAWESIIVDVTYRDRKLDAISLRPIALNYLGKGQPDVSSPLAANEFLFTRGLPAAAPEPKAAYILERVANFSKPFGTAIDIDGDRATVRLGR